MAEDDFDIYGEDDGFVSTKTEEVGNIVILSAYMHRFTNFWCGGRPVILQRLTRFRMK
jgi:hypothetical protein